MKGAVEDSALLFIRNEPQSDVAQPNGTLHPWCPFRVHLMGRELTEMTWLTELERGDGMWWGMSAASHLPLSPRCAP